MKNLASLFSADARDALKSELNIVLDDAHDYSADELEDLYEQITDDFPYQYSQSGEPDKMGYIFEGILDVFINHNLISQ